MHLVLIETSGNQRYIFATNKLRENVGASELTYRTGTEFTLKAVEVETGVTLDAFAPHILRANLCNTELNPSLATGKYRVEVITATSGKALLLVDAEETGRRIIHHVTKRALCDAPGLTVHGTISGELSEALATIHGGMIDVHEKLERLRYEVPGTEQRFLRLPFAAECATSGLPAKFYDTTGPESGAGARSVVADMKRRESPGGQQRMEAAVRHVASRLGRSVEQLERRFEQLDWLAVVHADGNGLGQIFLKFNEYLSGSYPEGNWRTYLDAYRRFSLALDTCTVNAFGTALKKLQDRFDRETENTRRRNPLDLPVVPLILGGDDLTVLCDGRYAVRFTYDFLTAFEAETQENHYDGIIPQIAESAFGVRRLASCAGIAIVKPHFPFYAAYNLAESLLQSAKQVKERVFHQHNGKNTPLPCSAFDYHVLYDASGADLERIRHHLQLDGGKTRLFGRPYVVTCREQLGTFRDSWVTHRTWHQLDTHIEAIRATDPDEDRRRLPNSMLHELRAGLFLGRIQANARMRLVRRRYQRQGFEALLEDRGEEGSLFWEEILPNGQKRYATGFLDALDLVDFWK